MLVAGCVPPPALVLHNTNSAVLLPDKLAMFLC